MRSRLPLNLSLLVSFTLGAPTVALAKVYDLAELITLARQRNLGVAASAAATEAVEAQLSEARRSWLPSGELTSLLAPGPNVRCEPVSASQDEREAACLATNVRDFRLSFSGVFTSTQVTVTQPVYTFGKISAGIQAARSGVAASRSREEGTAAEVELNVKRAYWGMKLAREIRETLNDGMTYLEEAQQRINKELAEGTGEVTVTDRLRLQTVRAEVTARVLEADRGSRLAGNGLQALVGPAMPEKIEIDAEPLEMVPVTVKPTEHYEALARQNRPELRAITQLAESMEALARLERRRQLPDLVLVGTARYAYAPGADDPRNVFFNDPFNTRSFGLAAALRMPLDLGVRNARANRAAAQAQETALRQNEAMVGVGFEVRRAHAELVEATERAKVRRDGERAAKKWITAIAQNFEVGLAEARDLQDALVAFFTARVGYLQSQHDVNIATAALSRATGVELAEPRPPAPAEE